MDSDLFSVFWKDRDLVYRGCNKKFLHLSGFSTPEEVVGKTDFDMPWGIDNEPAAEEFRASDRQVIESGAPVMHVVARIRQKDGFVLWTETNKIPIRDRAGRVKGVLCVLDDITQRKVAEQALEEANREMERLSTIDLLTQVPNRQYFTDQFQKEWSRARRHQMELACILFDVDHFKKFNEKFGLPAGDACLRRIVETAGQALKRPTDLLARYGGEKFVIILPSVGAEGARLVAEDIRRRIENLRLDTPKGAAGVTASFGVFAGFALYIDSPEVFLASAEKALLQAKNSGRNLVVNSEE
jgi:diguanylate cyclase (GGDEF)-like protein/PAS domain S-box-containing protein